MHATVMYQRSVLKRLGGFDTSFDGVRGLRHVPADREGVPDLVPPRARRRVPHARLEHERRAGPDAAVGTRCASLARAVHPKEPAVPRGLQGRPPRLEQALRRAARRADPCGDLEPPVEGDRARVGVLLRHYPRGLLSRCSPFRSWTAPPSLTGIETEEWPPKKPGPTAFDSGACAERPRSATYSVSTGRPIDRHYIESFLSRCAADVHGHVLEFADSEYTRRFGGSHVDKSDVLAVEDTNPDANIIGDLASADHIRPTPTTA